MSTADTQPTAAALFSGGPISIRTGRRTEISLPTSPYATVRIWSPDLSSTGSVATLADVFVLIGEDSAGAEVYRERLNVSAASPTTRQKTDAAVANPRGPDRSKTDAIGGGIWDLKFEVPPGDEDRLSSSGARFRLVHWPGGYERGAREIVSNRTYHACFVYGSTTGQSPVGRDGLAMTYLVATAFFHGDALAFPASAPGRSGYTLHQPTSLTSAPDELRAQTTEADHPVVDRRRVWALGLQDPTYDASEAASAAEGVGIPVGEEVAGAAPPSAAPAQSASTPPRRPEPLQEALAGRPLWLSLTTSDYATPAMDEAAAVRLLGVWQVGPDGSYTYASYPEDAEASPDDPSAALPEAHGIPARFVLIETGSASQLNGRAVYASTFSEPLPEAAVLATGKALTGTPLARVSFGTNTQEALDQSASGARYDAGADCWKVYLPDPIRLTKRLTRLARVASDQHDAWSKASGPARFGSGLVSSAAFNPEHQRAYLSEALYAATTRRQLHHRSPAQTVPSRDPLVNMEWAWDGFDPATAGPPVNDTAFGDGDALVWQVGYGLRRQDAYLAHRARVAARRLEAWLSQSAPVCLARNAAVARALGSTDAESVGELLAGAFGAMCDGGAGFALVRRMYTEAGILSAAQGCTFEDAERRILAPLEEARAWPWTSFLQANAFKTIWSIVEKGQKAGSELLKTVGYIVVYIVRQVSTSVQVAMTTRILLTGREAATLAATLQMGLEHGAPLIGSHDSGQVRIYRADGLPPTRAVFGNTVVEEKMGHAVGVVAQGNRRNASPPKWSIRYDLTSTTTTATTTTTTTTPVSIDMLPERRAAVDLFGDVIKVINVILYAETISRGLAEKRYGLSETVATGQLILEAAGIYETAAKHVTRISSEHAIDAAKMLGRAGRYFDYIVTGVGVYEGVKDTDPSGVQQEPDFDEGMIASALIGGAGGALITLGASQVTAAATAVTAAGGTVAAGAAAGAAAAPVLFVGLALVAVSGAVAWVSDNRETEARKQDDPLYTWLPTGSLWGKDSDLRAHREEMLKLARPGWSGDDTERFAPRIHREAKAFIEKAFRFPVHVRPRLDRAGTGNERLAGLTFQIDPHFVPAYGTLTLTAAIQRRGFDPIQLRCAVHYVRAGDGFRYIVMEEGETLTLGDDALDRHAARHQWAMSRVEDVTVRSPNGLTRETRHAVLSVHIGSHFRQLPPDLTDPAQSRGARAMRRGSLIGGILHGEATGNAREGLSEAGYVWPSSIAEAPVGLAEALASGRVVVTGFATFDPAAPLIPAPIIPLARPSAASFLAISDIGTPGAGATVGI